MSHCCVSSSNKKNKIHCPKCHHLSHKVSIKTVFYHLRKPWQWHHKEQDYYFCSTYECEVAYFNQSNSIIKQSELRSQVSTNGSPLVCYCFNVSDNDIKQDPSIKQFIIKKTKEQLCACELYNPSGRCCLTTLN
jgi:hypothetical protein